MILEENEMKIEALEEELLTLDPSDKAYDEKKKELSDACYLEENYTDNKKMEEISSQISDIDKQLEKLYADLDFAM